MKRLLGLVLVLAMALALSACAAPSAAPGEGGGSSAPASGDSAAAAQVLRLGQNAADLGSLDPHFATSTQDRSLVDMVFNGLLRYAPGNGAFEAMEPDLAADFPTMTMTDAGQEWTFTLRSGVMCHPVGDTPAYELTADDVVYSLEKAANPDRSAYAGEYAGMTFEAVDASTVKITLEQPLSPVLFTVPA